MGAGCCRNAENKNENSDPIHSIDEDKNSKVSHNEKLINVQPVPDNTQKTQTQKTTPAVETLNKTPTSDNSYNLQVKPQDNDGVEFKISHENFVGKKSEKISQEYKILSPPLGKGGFGEVRKAIHKASGLQRAVKFISKKELDEEEKSRLSDEDHPNIIKVYEFYEDDKFFYIVTELCTGGELFDKIADESYLGEREAALIMKQILSAVFYCHSHKIVHRDLKPENILYETSKEDSILKIIDFGTSQSFNPDEKMTQKYGTPYYIAPEVLRKQYDQKCDIWSCGVILYIMLCGYPPFTGSTDKEIMAKVAKGQYNMSGAEWDEVSREAKDFIKKMMEFDPTKRLDAEQSLNDPWIKSHSGKQVVDKPIAISALNNLKSFRANSKLQSALWVFLVSYCATAEEKNKMLTIFKALDVNGDGQLTKEELMLGYKKILNVNNPEEEVNEIMQKIDNNQSGYIDYSEFVFATMNKKTLTSKDRLQKIFKMFDKDSSGTISTAELRMIFQNAKVDDEQWKKIVGEVDQNGDGEISFKEFFEMMNKNI